MLSSISWTAYWIIINSLLLLYYGWWIKKYAASFGWDWLKPGHKQADNRMAGLFALPNTSGTNAATATNSSKDQTGTSKDRAGKVTATTTTRSETAHTQSTSTTTASGTTATTATTAASAATHPTLPSLAAELLQSITTQSEKATTEDIFIAALRPLLSTPPYTRLKNTPYQDKITQTILTIFKNLGSAQIDASVVKGWWDG